MKKNWLPSHWRKDNNDFDTSRRVWGLQQGIDRMFDDFFSSFPSSEMTNFNPGYDWEETDSHYLLTVDVPGIPKDQLKVELNGNRLTISGQRSSNDSSQEKRESTSKNYKKDKNGYHLYRSSFLQSFTLPEMLDPTQIEANYEHGTLCLSIPKNEESKSKTIPIGEGKSPQSSKITLKNAQKGDERDEARH